MSDLQNIINGEATEAAEVEQETVTKEQPTETAKVEKSAPTADDSNSWTKTAVLDERRKRQELEAKLAKYETGETEQTKQPTRPDVLEDQEGAFRHTEGAIENRILQERINLSRELMLDKHEDYAEMETVFVDLARQNPHLVNEMNNSSNPAKFAYNKAQEHTAYQEYLKTKDSDDYKDYLEAKKSGALIEREVEDSPAEKRKKSAVKVPDLINATSAKSGHADGEKSLKQILGGR